ncbi:hypothetical protein VP01_1314g3 [Puccinia sorghi]|uniref:Uncharacterized protein n=1 Tax=Puccinia sorghi TaxID=27349 RepID=A0A0L6VPK1_9BASI|nr:hypothetical protein VP01_1314g3 [Puccinia sorghi]
MAFVMGLQKILKTSIKEFTWVLVSVAGKIMIFKGERGGNPTKKCRKEDTHNPKFNCLINCPFSDYAYFQKKANHWKFSVCNHSHSLDPTAHTVLNKRLY